jgi:hypothetical protein
LSVDSRVMEQLDVLRAWIAAWNARDPEVLVSLADDDIEVEMPMGARRGLPALRDVVAQQSYGVRVYVGPQAFQANGERVLALGPIELRSVEERDKIVERQDNAGAGFTLRGDRVARFKPYRDAVLHYATRALTSRTATEPRSFRTSRETGART